MKKRTLLLIGMFMVGFLMFAGVAQAQDVCDISGGQGSFCSQPDPGGNEFDNPVLRVLDTVVRVLTIAVGVIATITVIISAIMFTTAGGDAAQASKARSALIYSLVAIIVAIFARVIVSVVLSEVAT